MSRTSAIVFSGIIGAAAAIACAWAAGAAILPRSVAHQSISPVRPVGEICGCGRRAGPFGTCVAYGWDSAQSYCPAGTHVGPDGASCRPN